MKHFKTLPLIVLVFIVSCKLTDKDIEKQSWKYAEGYHIGDWIEFNNSIISLNNVTILKNGKAIAKIISSKNDLPGKNNLIIIESIFSREKGVYIAK